MKRTAFPEVTSKRSSPTSIFIPRQQLKKKFIRKKNVDVFVKGIIAKEGKRAV